MGAPPLGLPPRRPRALQGRLHHRARQPRHARRRARRRGRPRRLGAAPRLLGPPRQPDERDVDPLGGRVFADVAAGLGVPRERILTESRSTNTGENVDFTRRLLAERGLVPRVAIAVQKPYMERRTLATFAGALAGARGPASRRRSSTSTPTPRSASRADDVVQIMVGDLQRLIVYGAQGLVGAAADPARGDGGLRGARGRGLHEAAAAGGLSSRL